jgi:hypothetical protein
VSYLHCLIHTSALLCRSNGLKRRLRLIVNEKSIHSIDVGHDLLVLKPWFCILYCSLCLVHIFYYFGANFSSQVNVSLNADLMVT